MNPFIDKTHHQALAYLATKFSDRDALVFRQQRFSFSEVQRRVDEASARLATLGLPAGATVAIWIPNRPEFLWYLLGAAQMGLVAVVLNTRLRRDEVRYQIGQSDSRAVLVPGAGAFRDFLGELEGVCPSVRSGPAGGLKCDDWPMLRHVLCVDPVPAGYVGVDDWSQGPASNSATPPPATDPDQPSLVFYTSGTTSLPKGVMLGHCLWRKGYDAGTRLGLSLDDRLYTCVPLFGMAGLLAGGPLTAWAHGAAVVLDERFDAGHCLDTLAAERCTVFQMMPTMLDPLLAHPAFETADRSNWRVAMVLTSAPSVLRMAVEKLGFRHIVCGYGMTESTALVTRTAWDQSLDAQIATNGAPLPNCYIRIVDPESERELAAGQQGEILIGGYCLMRGYYRKPEETARALTADGWLRTGDAGILNEDGTLVFKGRLRDGYKHNGFNVSTAEVEAVAGLHPGVAAVAIVGMPDPHGGEIGVAFVVERPGIPVGEGALLDFLRPRLASFKLPACVFTVEELPRTAGTEKVQPYRLREMAAALLRDRCDA